MVWGTAVWAVRDGPAGPRVSIISTFPFSFANNFSPSAITAVSSMNAIKSRLNGRGICIVMISRLGGSTVIFPTLQDAMFRYVSITNTFDLIETNSLNKMKYQIRRTISAYLLTHVISGISTNDEPTLSLQLTTHRPAHWMVVQFIRRATFTSISLGGFNEPNPLLDTMDG